MQQRRSLTEDNMRMWRQCLGASVHPKFGELESTPRHVFAVSYARTRVAAVIGQLCTWWMHAELLWCAHAIGTISYKPAKTASLRHLSTLCVQLVYRTTSPRTLD